MGKVVLLTGRQETVVAQVAVVEHVRAIRQVYIQVGQVKVAIHRSRLGVAQQACHALELIGPVIVAGGKEQPVRLHVLHITSPTKTTCCRPGGGGLRPPPPGGGAAAAAGPPPSPPPKKKGGKGRGGGEGEENLPDKTEEKCVRPGTCLPGQVVGMLRDFLHRCDYCFVAGEDV